MNLFIIIAIIWGASALIRSAREKRARANAQRIASEQARIKREMREMRQQANEEIAARIALEREQMKQRREQEKLTQEQEKQAKAQAAAWEKQRREDERRDAQLAKHEERISTLEFKAKQAEADILNEQSRLDHYTEKLSALDDELKRLDSDIEYYQLANKVDAENKARAAKAKVEDKIFNFEEKVRACEKRMSKAQHTKELCEMQMSA